MEMSDSSRISALSLMLFFGITSAFAQTAPPLTAKLVGSYQTSTGHRANVVPVELSDIKVDGDRVTGIISNYQTVSGNCIAKNTPFTGTYRDGTLAIQSERMVSQKADGTNCGGMVLNAKFDGKSFSGTFGLGKDNGIRIDLTPK